MVNIRPSARKAKMDKAAHYIRCYRQEIGCEVQSQSYTVHGVECTNLSAEIPGKENPNEILVLGAHYDSVGGSPGANDNGPAVAALLEISRLLHQRPYTLSVLYPHPGIKPHFMKAHNNLGLALERQRGYASLCEGTAHQLSLRRNMTRHFLS